MIQLGSVVRDSITGFQGVAVARHEWLHGCARYSVQPETLNEGKPIEPQAFDEPQLVVVREAQPKPTPTTGGPQKDPSASRANESR